MLTLVSLHRTGWTTQTFVGNNAYEKARRTWEHTKTLSGCLATILYSSSAGIMLSWLFEDKTDA